MDYLSIFKMAFDNIRSNLLRTMLTISIIAIGIMALVGILTALDGITYALSASFSGLGANSFEIVRKSDRRGGPHSRSNLGPAITYREAMSFKKRFKSRSKVTVSKVLTNMAKAGHKKKETHPNVRLEAVDENYLVVNGINLAAGRGFTENESSGGSNVAIIGEELVEELFGGKPESAIGRSITVNNLRFKLVGVQQSKGAGIGGGTDRFVLIPVTVGKSLDRNKRGSYRIIVRVNDVQEMESQIAEATALFRQVRRLRVGEEEDFNIQKPDSMIALLEENTVTLRIATISIGLITLLGAAIGLMNMMFVSVTERTKEIGIHKALGARKSDIRKIFLAEALLIGQLGGLAGIVLGVIIGNLIPLKMGGHFLMPWGWLILGILLCILVGLFSGYYPAKRASELDPIEALRYE